MEAESAAGADILALAARFTERFTADEIVLYAGTNLASPRAAALLATPLGQMPAMGRGLLREQPGVAEIAMIEAAAETLACRLFGGDWAELRLPSCTLANLAVFAAICRPGDRIAATALRAGGHVSHHAQGAPALLGLEVVELPHDAAAQAPDDAASAALILASRPKLAVLGASFMPRPFGFARIAAACRTVGAVLLYDIAHVAGLVAGGAFPNPLGQGADLLTASTYKSLGGPPGGMVVGRHGALEERVRAVAYPLMTANYDAGRVAALGVSLAEAELWIAPYAAAMCANARALEAALRHESVAVIASEAHHLGLPLGDRTTARAGMAALEACGILCGTSAMLTETASQGVRLGTQLVTRRGFTPTDMVELGRLIATALHGHADAAAVRAQVTRLSRRRPHLAYCHDGV